MPALPAVPGVIKLQLHWSYGGDPSLSTRFYFQFTGAAPSTAQLNTWCAQVSAAAGTQFAPLLDVNASYAGCQAVDLSSSTSFSGADNTVHTGTRAGQPLPASACCLRNLVINRRYRGGKPRQYFPFGVSADLANPQQWTAAAVAAFGTAIANFVNGIVATPPGATTISGQVNVSYYEGFKPFTTPSGRVKNISQVRTVPPPIPIDPIIAQSINGKVGTQRRRIAA